MKVETMMERGRVQLNMIVTKTGDGGETYLNDGSRIPKSSPRIKALATIEQIAVKLGYFIFACDQDTLHIPIANGETCQMNLTELAHSFQQEMYDLGSDVSTPMKENETLSRFPIEKVEEITTLIGELTPILEPLDTFVLPQGSLRVLLSHDIRTMIRQAELQVWEIEEPVNPAVPQYLNRLSDFWFVFSRILQFEEQRSDDIEIKLWEPNQQHPRGIRKLKT